MTTKELRNYYFLYSEEKEIVEIRDYLESLGERVYDISDDGEIWYGFRYVSSEWTQTKAPLEDVKKYNENIVQVNWSAFKRKTKLLKIKYRND